MGLYHSLARVGFQGGFHGLVQDETGASAILAEQLNASMGGTPQEHRELQGQESQDFQQLFKGGIRYLSGGAASGFHHVEDAPHQATLAQIKVGQLAPLLQVLMQQQALHAYRSLPYSQRSAASPAL